MQRDAIRAHDPLALPSYWSEDPQAAQLRRWKAVAVHGSTAEWKALQSAVGLTPGGGLGGRDQRLLGAHSGFRLRAAWRIENPNLFKKYSVEKQRLKSIIEQSRRRTPTANVRREWHRALSTLPCELDRTVNELYLSHGTKPDVVLSVISNGLNERYSGGLFGQGTYFAEDLGKNDQYVTEDSKYGEHRDLHKELYGDVRHPGNVFYVFLCRVTLGHFCTTKD